MEVNEQIQIQGQKEVALINVCAAEETTFALREKVPKLRERRNNQNMHIIAFCF